MNPPHKSHHVICMSESTTHRTRALVQMMHFRIISSVHHYIHLTPPCLLAKKYVFLSYSHFGDENNHLAIFTILDSTRSLLDFARKLRV